MRFLVLLAFIGLAACSSNSELSNATAPVERAYAAGDGVPSCVQRGIAYFKEIGSYPTLSSTPNRGRSADEVALERCKRTLTAF